ncbi:MAG: PTS sugar transporter subunit IIA [Candidatus Omnitrophica bacterium]|nr:PTS sugar transporter subunit IIA [Candidatus Omnitrophota bacterium]
MNKVEIKEIRISELLKEKYIDLGLKEKDKPSLIAGLVDLINKSGNLKSKKAFLDAVLEREKLGSTGIGGGIAIPHAKSQGVSDFILAFARQDCGINFGSLDGEKTFLFFIVASPESDVGGHLKVLSAISRLVKDRATVELLKKAKDKKAVLKIISDMENCVMR